MKLTLAALAAGTLLSPAFPSTDPRPASAPGDDSGTALAVRSAGIDGLLIDSRDAGLSRVLSLFESYLKRQARASQGPASVEPLASSVYQLLTRPFALRIGPGASVEHPVWFQLAVRCEDQRTARNFAGLAQHFLMGVGVRASVEEDSLRKAETPMGELSFMATKLGEHGHFMVSLETALPEPFTVESQKLSPAATLGMQIHYDPSLVRAIVEPLLGGSSSGREQLEALELFGIIGEKTPRVRFFLGYTRDQALSITRREGYLAYARENGSFIAEQLRKNDLQRIPADATLAGLAQVRPSDLLAWLERIEEGTSRKAEEEFEQRVGLRLRGDLLDLLGPTAGFYLSAGNGGGGFPSTVLFSETPSEAKLRRTMDRLAALLDSETENVALQTWEHGPVVCTSVVFPELPLPIQPCYAVAQGAFFLAADPNALKGALDQLLAETCVLDHPQVAAALPQNALSGWTRFGFFDTPYYLERGYAPASQMARMAENFLRSPRGLGEDPGSLLPEQQSLTLNTRAWISWSRIEDGDWIENSTRDRSIVANLVALGGTPLFSALPILSAISIPRLLSARIAANESGSIASLRSIAAAQAELRAAGAIDTDGDGNGEYAYFGELTGVAPLRIASDTGPQLGNRATDVLSPPFLSPSFAVRRDGRGAGVVERHGYYFQMWLPGRPQAGKVPGVAEAPYGGSNDSPVPTDPEAGERLWCCYAWPADAGRTGKRVFVIDHEGNVHAMPNHGGFYTGLPETGGRSPRFDSARTSPGDLAAPLANGRKAQDGNVWSGISVGG